MQLVNSGGEIVRDYRYDAFGVETGEEGDGDSGGEAYISGMVWAECGYTSIKPYRDITHDDNFIELGGRPGISKRDKRSRRLQYHLKS